DAVIEHEPALRRAYGLRAAAYLQRRCAPLSRLDEILLVRFPVKAVRGGRQMNRGTGVAMAVWRSEEVEFAERPRQRPELAGDLAFEIQHVLVLVIEHQAAQVPIEAVRRSIERCGVTR